MECNQTGWSVFHQEDLIKMQIYQKRYSGRNFAGNAHSLHYYHSNTQIHALTRAQKHTNTKSNRIEIKERLFLLSNIRKALKTSHQI